MLKKVDGARRIRLNGEEYYVMTVRRARQVFPDCYFEDDRADTADIDELHYKDNTIILISGVEENKTGICASSDELEDDRAVFRALYDIVKSDGNISFAWESYTFPPIIIAISELLALGNEMLEDDHLKIHSRVSMEGDVFPSIFATVEVTNAAKEIFHIHHAIELLLDGISNYSEADSDMYHETHGVTAWGEGEEGIDEAIGEPEHSTRLPIQIDFEHRNIIPLIRALNDSRWRDVPYIPHFKNHMELLVGEYE